MTDNLIEQKMKKINWLPIPTKEGCCTVLFKDILYLEAQKNYTRVYKENPSEILESSRNLGIYDSRLQSTAFLRVHDSFIVNMNKVKKYYNGENAYLVLTNNITIPISKSKKSIVLKLLKL